MPKVLLPQIEKIRQTRFLTIGRDNRGQLAIQNSPPTKSAGFYWIYSNYSQTDLERQQEPACSNAIDIGLLAQLHCGLANSCNIDLDDFKLVYNGIAGVGTGLRERLHQHFNGGEGTGSLAILRTDLSDLDRWRISYATIEVRGDHKPDVYANFDKVAKHVERMWRLEYGWPILCTQ